METHTQFCLGGGGDLAMMAFLLLSGQGSEVGLSGQEGALH